MDESSIYRLDLGATTQQNFKLTYLQMLFERCSPTLTSHTVTALLSPKQSVNATTALGQLRAFASDC